MKNIRLIGKVTCLRLNRDGNRVLTIQQDGNHFFQTDVVDKDKIFEIGDEVDVEITRHYEASFTAGTN